MAELHLNAPVSRCWGGAHWTPSGDVGPMLHELDVPVFAAAGELPGTGSKSAPSGDVGSTLGRAEVISDDGGVYAPPL
jgi:hypothetical protein